MKIVDRTEDGFLVEVPSAEMNQILSIGKDGDQAVKMISYNPDGSDSIIGREIDIANIISVQARTAAPSGPRSGYPMTLHGPEAVVPLPNGRSIPVEMKSGGQNGSGGGNTSKAERLAYVQSEGKRLAAEKERLVKEVEQLTASVPAVKETASPEIDRLTAERDAAKASASDYTGIAGRQDLLDRKASLEKAIQDAKGSVAEDRAAIEAEIKTISEQYIPKQTDLTKFSFRDSAEKRIKELKGEEKRLAQEFEELEKMLYLIETFIKKKVALLTDRINGKFEVVRFKLFNQLVNGGIEECCVFTVGGVPYDSGLNSAARTQGGLDIIRTLQNHYGIAPAVFIDNRESCTEIPAMDCQIVNLIVSPADKVLRVERAGRAERKVAQP